MTAKGIGLGLNGSPVAEGQWCFPEVLASIRKCQAQLLPLVVCAFHQWRQGGQLQQSHAIHILELFLSAGYLKDSFCIRQTQNEERPIKYANAKQDEVSLWKCSRLKEAKET